VNVLEKFAPQLATMVSEGFASISPEKISIHRAGLLQIDRLLHPFFLPHHRFARYT
jgi:oxygen-independent coproporphyrinogen-3 oxidase